MCCYNFLVCVVGNGVLFIGIGFFGDIFIWGVVMINLFILSWGVKLGL